MIHRDLKPSNIMVGNFGEVQVMDWGLAKVLSRGGEADDANGRERERTLKRGRGQVVIPIDALDAEERYRLEPAHELTAERLFERRWVLALLDHVLDRLAAETSQSAKSRLFEALKPSLLGTAEKVSYAGIAEELGCSEAAARVATHRLRTRYRALLREEVARTLDDPDAVEEEIRSLFAAFAR